MLNPGCFSVAFSLWSPTGEFSPFFPPSQLQESCRLKAVVAKRKAHVLSCGDEKPVAEPLCLLGTGLGYVGALWGDGEGRGERQTAKPAHPGAPIPPRIWFV